MTSASGGGSEGEASQQSHPADDLLRELEELLVEEHRALARLDREVIEVLSSRKLEVDERLRAVVEQHPLSDEQRPAVERVRTLALQSQRLLAHARSCVQGVLSLLSPGKNPGYSVGPSSKPPPIALDFRR